MKYWIITFGCQMNKSDSERIAKALENINYESASEISEADLIIINACSVRQSVIHRVYGQIKNISNFQKSYPAILQSLAENRNNSSCFSPQSLSRNCGIAGCKLKTKILLTGCILESDIKKLKEKVDYILPIKTLLFWKKYLKQKSYFYYPNQRDIKFNKTFGADYLKIQPLYQNNFSALVPISTGCNNFCSYCAVPYVRGPEYSRPMKDILDEVKNLVKNGCKEIFLLGQNVNSYKFKIQNSKLIKFSDLLKKINNIPGNFWIRFLTSHPKDMSDELINAIAECDKVCKYIHFPAQSGNDKILKKMNRKYKIRKYENLVEKIRAKIPNAAISTDIIVGFPGETKKQFQNTVKLFKKIKFDMAYISKYSPRSGTAAFKLKNNVPQEEKKQREKILTEILKKTVLENNRKYIGSEIEVLIEKKKNEFLIGKSRQYKTVKIPNVKFQMLNQCQIPKSKFHARNVSRSDAGGQILNSKIIGDFVKVKIIGATSWGLKGEIL